MTGAKWDRTLLVWMHDEHGGYYDHVPPPTAVKPDDIAPMIGPHDVQAGFDMYGWRVPAVVVSPYAKPNAVTNVVHDHTSVLSTIEAWWNLPPMTRRDAAANTLLDFLDLHSPPAFLDPPALKAAAYATRPAQRGMTLTSQRSPGARESRASVVTSGQSRSSASAT